MNGISVILNYWQLRPRRNPRSTVAIAARVVAAHVTSALVGAGQSDEAKPIAFPDSHCRIPDHGGSRARMRTRSRPIAKLLSMVSVCGRWSPFRRRAVRKKPRYMEPHNVNCRVYC